MTFRHTVLNKQTDSNDKLKTGFKLLIVSNKNVITLFLIIKPNIKISNFTIAYELFNSAKRSKFHYYYLLPKHYSFKYFLLVFVFFKTSL